MSSSIRNGLLPLADAKGCSNAGLALERYVGSVDGVDAKNALLDNVVRIPVSGVYEQAFRRWKAHLESLPQCISEAFQVTDRLVVGLGAESVLETAITLNRIYGVPLIPGSAIKGMARHYLEHYSALPKEELESVVRVLFGDQTSAGYVTFFDAWYVPAENGKRSPLRRDVMTVHHPKYYSTHGVGGPEVVPTDFDDPNPIAFISAVGQYLIAVQGPDPDWTKTAFDIIRRALAEDGIGGKTSSGYGRMVPASEYKGPHYDAGSVGQRESRGSREFDNSGDLKKVVVPPPKPAPKSTPTVVTREWVTIVKMNAGKGIVRTEKGEEIPCTNMPSWRMGDRGKADVTREAGKAIRALWKAWN